MARIEMTFRAKSYTIATVEDLLRGIRHNLGGSERSMEAQYPYERGWIPDEGLDEYRAFIPISRAAEALWHLDQGVFSDVAFHNCGELLINCEFDLVGDITMKGHMQWQP